MAVAAILDLFESQNSAVRSAVPENPTLEPNMKWIGSLVAEIWTFAYVGAYGTPILGGRGGRRGSAMVPLKRAMVVWLSIVTVALFCNHSAAICDRMSPTLKSTGHFGPKFPGVPLGVDPLMFGFAESVHPRLNG